MRLASHATGRLRVRRPQRQYLYFCTSNVSKVSIPAYERAAGVWLRVHRLRQYLYLCTSNVSKVSIPASGCGCTAGCVSICTFVAVT
jgi:hypothetical protein